jgi:hypothetical protein
LALENTKIRRPTAASTPEKAMISALPGPAGVTVGAEATSAAHERDPVVPVPADKLPSQPESRALFSDSSRASSVKPEKRVSDLSVPPGQMLFPLVFMDSGEQLVLVDKSTKTLFHLRFVQGKAVLAKAYPCIVGRNIDDKEKAGDMATPEGIYFFIEFIAAGKLPKNYGGRSLRFGLP